MAIEKLSMDKLKFVLSSKFDSVHQFSSSLARNQDGVISPSGQ